MKFYVLLALACASVAETPLRAGGSFANGARYLADQKVYELWRERLPTALVPRTVVKGHDKPRHVAFHLKGVRDVTLDFKGRSSCGTTSDAFRPEDGFTYVAMTPEFFKVTRR